MGLNVFFKLARHADVLKVGKNYFSYCLVLVMQIF